MARRNLSSIASLILWSLLAFSMHQGWAAVHAEVNHIWPPTQWWAGAEAQEPESTDPPNTASEEQSGDNQDTSADEAPSDDSQEPGEEQSPGRHGHGSKCSNQDNEAYFQNFKRKFPVPEKPLQYNGASMPERCYEGDDDEHFFIIGDYGGITCNDKVNGRDPWSYTCGWRDHGENRGRKDVYVKCADNTKDHPERGRHFTASDAKPQFFVADQMRARAPRSKPRYFLNGGDNFYFGGLDIRCGQSPMDQIHERTRIQFDGVFEKMYSGQHMDVPWFSTFGNHDFGGRKFNAAWDQQIAYTWYANSTHRWYLPGFYWHQRVNYPTKNFTIDIFMLDTNKGDAHPWTVDPGHNICGSFNDGRNSCAHIGGPKDRFSCHHWFETLWKNQAKWLEEKLKNSDADWQILVTHFPPEYFNRFWKPLTIKYGIDLFVGSHRHSQEVHKKSNFAGLNYVVAGGGGGITSEFNPGGDWRGQRQYGFMDVTINKTHMYIESVNEHGRVSDTGLITPRPGQGEPTCAHYGCNASYQSWAACQCTSDCWTHVKDWHKENRCCEDYSATCPALTSCAAFGCGAKYDWRKPCQCEKGCEKKGNCCHDYQELCNTPEAQAAEANCSTACKTGGPPPEVAAVNANCDATCETGGPDPELKKAEANCTATCEIEGQHGSYPCSERVAYAIKHDRKSKEDAINGVNEECAGQCSCDVKYYGKRSEPVSKYSCSERVAYGIKHQRKSTEDAINDINEECAGQCNCTVEYYGKTYPAVANYPCSERVAYEIKNQHKSTEEAINDINEECSGQCACTAKYYAPSSSSSLVQEDTEELVTTPEEQHEETMDDQDEQKPETNMKQQNLVEKKILLQEELREIELKLSGTSQTDVDEAGRIWAEYMNF